MATPTTGKKRSPYGEKGIRVAIKNIKEFLSDLKDKTTAYCKANRITGKVKAPARQINKHNGLTVAVDSSSARELTKFDLIKLCIMQYTVSIAGGFPIEITNVNKLTAELCGVSLNKVKLDARDSVSDENSPPSKKIKGRKKADFDDFNVCQVYTVHY